MSIVTIAFSHLKTCSVNLPASWSNSLYSKVNQKSQSILHN